jgi:hypothetical protein
MAKKPIMRSASFHGPILPELKSNDSDQENSKRKLRRKERDRKQMEENSKVFILVAESDEVCGMIFAGRLCIIILYLQPPLSNYLTGN